MKITNVPSAAPISAKKPQASTPPQAELQGDPEFDTYTASSGETVNIGSDRQLVGDGSIDDWVRTEFGTGLLSGIDDADVPQFLESKNDLRIQLPGDQDTSAQILTARTEGDHRTFRLDTIFGNKLHILEANYQNGAFLADSVKESLYLPKA